MSQETREDFHKWQIDLAYEAQNGLCKKCGAGLEQTGFHAHHEDGDHTNNSLANLSLLCPKCHFTTFKGSNPWDAHKDTEKRILESLLKVIDLVLDPASKMSGATLEKLNDSMTMALRSSRYFNEIDYGKMTVPASILQMRGMAEAKVQGEAYTAGFMDGVKATVSKIGVKNNEC
jgi:ribosomal protein S27AE